MGQGLFDSRMPALATKLVTKFSGASGTVSITRITKAGDYNPLTGSESAPTETTTVQDVTPPVPVTQRMVDDNSGVLMGDFVGYVDAARYTFTQADVNTTQVNYSTLGAFTIVWVKEFWSGANIAYYEIFLRRL